MNNHDLVIIPLRFFVRLNFHLVVTRSRRVLHLLYIGKWRKLIKTILLICYINRNNLVFKAFLLEPLLLGSLSILNTFHYASIFNGFHLLFNVPDLACVCYFTCVIIFSFVCDVWSSIRDIQMIYIILPYNGFSVITGVKGYFVGVLRYNHTWLVPDNIVHKVNSKCHKMDEKITHFVVHVSPSIFDSKIKN